MIPLAGGATYILNPVGTNLTIIGIETPAFGITLAAASDADLLDLAARFTAIAQRGVS